MTLPRPLLARVNWYWIFQAGGWGLLGLMMAAMGPARGYAGDAAWSRYLLVCVWGSASGILLSDLWHRVVKRRGRAGWGFILCGVLALGTLNTFVQALGYAVIRPFGPVRSLDWLPGALLSWWAVHLGWNICYLAVLALRRANRLEAEALRLEVSAKDAELRALQAQVNPHFFFNSMNSVRALVFENPDSAARMIDELTSVMRYALQAGQQDTVPLAAEIDAVRAYLAIEQIRFEERLRVQVDVGPGLDDARIPPMSLQTLVENAVKYGVETRVDGSDIRIHARRAGDGTIHVEIANLGALQAFATSTRLGLANTRKRLALVLGADASLDLSEGDGWVRATLRLPEKT